MAIGTWPLREPSVVLGPLVATRLPPCRVMSLARASGPGEAAPRPADVIGVAVATELEELRGEDAGNIIGTGLRVSADIAVITPARYVFELAENLGEAL